MLLYTWFHHVGIYIWEQYWSILKLDPSSISCLKTLGTKLSHVSSVDRAIDFGFSSDSLFKPQLGNFIFLVFNKFAWWLPKWPQIQMVWETVSIRQNHSKKIHFSKLHTQHVKEKPVSDIAFLDYCVDDFSSDKSESDVK